MPKGSRDTQVQTQPSSPAQHSTEGSCSCSTPLGNTTDLPTGEEKATQHWVGSSQVMSHVPSLQTGSVSEAQEPSASYSVSQLEAGREMDPIRSLFQEARPAWEHPQAVKALASGVLCYSLGSVSVSFCLTNQTGSCLHEPSLGTDTTFKNYIDCSLFEVVITGLVEGH